HVAMVNDALLATLLEGLARRLLAALGFLLGCRRFCLCHVLNRLLLRQSALAWALARACVGPGALAARRQVALGAQPAIAADLHEPLDVHGDLLAEIALYAAHFLEHAADLPHVVLGQILDADVRADAGR